MASIDRRNGRWRARYRTPDGRSRSQTFDRKVDAERFLVKVSHQQLTGAYVDPSAGRVTVRTYGESWRAAQVHRPTTQRSVESILRLHVYPSLGDRPIGAVRPTELQAWVRGLTGQLAPGTVELVYRYVVAIFRAAVADRVIVASPCVGVRLPQRHRREVVPLEVAEVAALTRAMPERYRALVALAAGTGMRQGETFGLTIDRVDFLHRRVVIDRQLVWIAREGVTFGPPKTAASVRTVPLPDVVLDALAEHLKAWPVEPEGLVFLGADGGPLRRGSFSDVWRPAVARAGLPKGTRFHDLRHFFASLLIRHGESVKTVQARLGHASAVETLNTYAHLWPDSEDRTRGAVDAALGTHLGHTTSKTAEQ